MGVRAACGASLMYAPACRVDVEDGSGIMKSSQRTVTEYCGLSSYIRYFCWWLLAEILNYIPLYHYYYHCTTGRNKYILYLYRICMKGYICFCYSMLSIPFIIPNECTIK